MDLLHRRARKSTQIVEAREMDAIVDAQVSAHVVVEFVVGAQGPRRRGLRIRHGCIAVYEVRRAVVVQGIGVVIEVASSVVLQRAIGLLVLYAHTGIEQPAIDFPGVGEEERGVHRIPRFMQREGRAAGEALWAGQRIGVRTIAQIDDDRVGIALGLQQHAVAEIPGVVVGVHGRVVAGGQGIAVEQFLAQMKFVGRGTDVLVDVPEALGVDVLVHVRRATIRIVGGGDKTGGETIRRFCAGDIAGQRGRILASAEERNRVHLAGSEIELVR